MEILEKAKVLGDAGRYDSCGPKMCEVNVNYGLGGIYHAKAEHKTCRLFKTLMDNSCSFDCKYCSNSTGCTKKSSRARFEPKELASLFMYLKKSLRVEGLFLSSGIAGNPNKSTERMIETVRMLRFDFKFRGYIHFKVLPGTSHELVKQASELANRMSINIEAPSKSVLGELSTCKDYGIDIVRRQRWISRLAKSQTTQVILNNLASDKDVLKMADWEYSNLGLKRVYYSSFRPVKGTPLEGEEAEPFWRQNRLYNADFLMRDYSYRPRELFSIMDGGMLPREDPKLIIAKNTLENPIDISQASLQELIRVPGIGPRTANKIIKNRKIVKGYEGLQKIGVNLKRAGPFIEFKGKRQASLKNF